MADEGVNDDRIYALRRSLEHALEHRELLRRACERGLAALESAALTLGSDPAEHRVCREMRDALACTADAPAGSSAALAALAACEVSMDTAALCGLPQQLPPAYRDSWVAAHTQARAVLAGQPPPPATLTDLARAHAALDRIERAADAALKPAYVVPNLTAILEQIAEEAREGRGP